MLSEAELTHDCLSFDCPAHHNNQYHTHMSLLPQGSDKSNGWNQGVLSVTISCLMSLMWPVTWSLTAPTLIQNKKDDACSARPSVYPTVRDLLLPLSLMIRCAFNLTLSLCAVLLSTMPTIMLPRRRRSRDRCHFCHLSSSSSFVTPLMLAAFSSGREP